MMRLASSTVGTGSVVPGTIGTPAAAISSRALVLEPIASIADADGDLAAVGDQDLAEHRSGRICSPAPQGPGRARRRSISRSAPARRLDLLAVRALDVPLGAERAEVLTLRAAGLVLVHHEAV